jgi:hypothetical protein
MQLHCAESMLCASGGRGRQLGANDTLMLLLGCCLCSLSIVQATDKEVWVNAWSQSRNA